MEIDMKKSLFASAAVAAAIGTLAVAGPADARVRAGVLSCVVSPSVGFVVGSQKTMDCVFTPVHGRREHYVGWLTNVGLDVGFTNGGSLGWIVYAASRPGKGALAGGYGGASAQATVAAGLGANVLIGGFDDSISLQPLSLGTQTGLNVALGVGGLRLAYAR
jgi:hypothetical protein